MQPISRHRLKKMKLIGQVWYTVVNVALNDWRERRLDMKDNREGIDSSRLKAILSSSNATDAVRYTNFEGISTLQLCYDIGHI